jgi:hypothetical protein
VFVAGVALVFAAVIWSFRWHREVPTMNPRGTANLVIDGKRILVALAAGFQHCRR